MKLLARITYEYTVIYIFSIFSVVNKAPKRFPAPWAHILVNPALAVAEFSDLNFWTSTFWIQTEHGI